MIYKIFMLFENEKNWPLFAQ